MDKQRIYDAMLIKAFRSDVLMGTLNQWLKVYDIDLLRDKDLYKRIPEHVYLKKRVQEMVGQYMKVLADRLWDTDKTDDIKTLEWMQRIDCVTRKETKTRDTEKSKLLRQHSTDVRTAKLIKENVRAEKRSNQWGITKGKPKSRYGRRIK